jgi:hypothetical protein
MAYTTGGLRTDGRRPVRGAGLVARRAEAAQALKLEDWVFS